MLPIMLLSAVAVAQSAGQAQRQERQDLAGASGQAAHGIEPVVLPSVPTVVLDGLKRSNAELWTDANHAMRSGNNQQAIRDLHDMVELNPKDTAARLYLGIALAQAGDLEGAIAQYSKALEMAPRDAGVHYDLGVVLTERGSEQEAIRHFQAAVRYDPQLTKAHFQLANLLMRGGEYREAAGEYAKVIEMEPRNGFARLMEAMALIRLKEYAEGEAKLEQGHTVVPEDADLTTALARLLAACPEKSVRDGPRALSLIEGVIQEQKSFDLDQGQTLAMALAAVGQFQQAVRVQSMMVAGVERAHRVDLERLLEVNLELYEHDQPCLTPWRDDDPIFSPVPAKPQALKDLSPPATMGNATQN